MAEVERIAAGQATKYQARGFANVKAFKGGVEAWQKAEHPMAAA